ESPKNAYAISESLKAVRSSGWLNWGYRALKGRERTSATAETLTARNRRNSTSTEWFEWPMLNSRLSEIICSGLRDPLIMRPILARLSQGAHHGHDPARLDAHGETVLPGRRGCRKRARPHRPAVACQAPRRSRAYLRLVD